MGCICPAHDRPCHRKRRPHRRLCSGCIDLCPIAFTTGRGRWRIGQWVTV